MNPIFETLTLAAGAVSRGYSTTAKVLTVKTATLPINLSINGGPQQAIQAGSVIELAPASNFQFINPQPGAVTVTFWLGDRQVNFSPQDNSASNAATFPLGNLGVITGAGAAGGLPACTSINGVGFLQITNAMALVIPTIYNGHRRQSITFSVDPAAAYNLHIADGNGNSFISLSRGQQIQLTSDAALIIGGAGGTVGVTIGQVFLQNN